MLWFQIWVDRLCNEKRWVLRMLLALKHRAVTMVVKAAARRHGLLVGAPIVLSGCSWSDLMDWHSRSMMLSPLYTVSTSQDRVRRRRLQSFFISRFVAVILELGRHTFARSVRVVALRTLSIRLIEFWVWTSEVQLRDAFLRRVFKMSCLAYRLLVIIKGVLPTQSCNCSCDDIIGLILLHLLWKVEFGSEAFLVL